MVTLPSNDTCLIHSRVNAFGKADLLDYPGLTNSVSKALTISKANIGRIFISVLLILIAGPLSGYLRVFHNDMIFLEEM